MVFFSVVCLFALFFAALFFIIWIVKAILKKKTKMWLAAIVSFVIAISSFLAYGFIHDSQETKATSTIYSNETTTQAIITERTSFAETTDYSFAEVTTTTHPQTTVEISSTIPSSSETERTSEVTTKSKKTINGFWLTLLIINLCIAVSAVFIWVAKVFLKEKKTFDSVLTVITVLITFLIYAIALSTTSKNDGNYQTTSIEITTSQQQTTTSPTTTTKPTTTTEKATTTTKLTTTAPTSTTRDSTLDETVYVSRQGVIHSIPNCSRMRHYTSMTLERAYARGYRMCQRCW